MDCCHNNIHFHNVQILISLLNHNSIYSQQINQSLIDYLGSCFCCCCLQSPVKRNSEEIVRSKWSPPVVTTALENGSLRKSTTHTNPRKLPSFDLLCVKIIVTILFICCCLLFLLWWCCCLLDHWHNHKQNSVVSCFCCWLLWRFNGKQNCVLFFCAMLSRVRIESSSHFHYFSCTPLDMEKLHR